MTDVPARSRPDVVPDRPVPERPLLRPGLRVVADGGRLLLEHGGHLVVLEGRAVDRLLPNLLPLLDGRRTVEEIAASLDLASALAVENAVGLLARHGAVCEGPPLEGRPRAARETVELLAAEAGLPPAVVAARLAGPVAVVGRSEVAAEVQRLLAAAGVAVTAVRRWRSARAGLVVAAPGRGEAGALRRWNRRALRLGIAWLPVLPFDGRLSVVGPLVLPGETACYECHVLRSSAAIGFGAESERLEHVQPAARSTFPLDAFAAAVASLHVLRWLGIRDPRLPGLLQTVELVDGIELRRHLVLRVPRCPACSGPHGLAKPLPWHDVPIEAAVA